MRIRISEYTARATQAIREDPEVRESVTGATLAFDRKRRPSLRRR